MKKTAVILSIIIFLISGVSCSKNVKKTPLSADETYEEALSYFNEGDYNKSIELFNDFFNEYPGSKWVDDAQFYYAESFFNLEDYSTALQEYQFLLNNFPNSKWNQEALLKKAQCLEKLSPIVQREQELTRRSLDTYEEFINRYPYSDLIDEAKKGRERMKEKLNRKLFEIGEIYLKIGNKDAAELYLKSVTNKSDKWRDKAYFLLGEIAESKGEDSLAAHYYRQINGERKEEARERLKSLN